MQIGDWKAAAGIAGIYNEARALGIETNIAELETFGFTVIEPENTGMPADFAAKLMDATQAIAKSEDLNVVDLNKQAVRPAQGRQLFNLLAKNPLYADALMAPAAQVMAKYLMGASYRLYSMVAFLKEGAAVPTPLHNDSTGMPPPLPFYGNVCNISWVLTDYAKESGTLCMLPGSHRLCRQPTMSEWPKFMGGQAEDDLFVPVLAKRGSLAVFHGNTWHGTYPKTTEAVRCHIALAACRNYVNPAENFADVPEATVERGGAEFARALGRSAWQGYGAEGPKLDRMALVRAAAGTVYG
jgi:ectoine hydroxylase-related dioxygenase (phytanoyl-CoA dioxygenase family)